MLLSVLYMPASHLHSASLDFLQSHIKFLSPGSPHAFPDASRELILSFILPRIACVCVVTMVTVAGITPFVVVCLPGL